MILTSQFGSRAQDHLSVGAHWVVAAFQEAARACGLVITNCRWQEEEDLDNDGDDRYVLTFDSAGAEDWEPFEASDLEDLPTSVRVRQSVEAQLQKLLARLGGQTGVRPGSDRGQTGVRPR